MMMNLNSERMSRVVAEAKAKVAGDKRWTNAIDKAVEAFDTNPYMHYDGHALLVLSESGEMYSANGTCQCTAFTKGQPCWHRAASKLVKRYFDAGA